MLARRLYGRFKNRSFVGRELVAVKFDTQGPAHVHSRVIKNLIVFLRLYETAETRTPKTGTRRMPHL